MPGKPFWTHFATIFDPFWPPSLFLFSKIFTHPLYSTHLYYFSWGNFRPTLIIPEMWWDALRDLYNLKNVKNTHGGVLLWAKLQTLACSFTKSNTSLRVFFTFLKLYKQYQIGQSISDHGDAQRCTEITRYWR